MILGAVYHFVDIGPDSWCLYLLEVATPEAEKRKLENILYSRKQAGKALCVTVLAHLPRTCLSKYEYDLGPGFDGDETCTVQVIQNGIRHELFAVTSVLLAIAFFYLGWKCGKPICREKETRTVSTQSPCTYTWWWQKPEFKVLRVDSHGVGV